MLLTSDDIMSSMLCIKHRWQLSMGDSHGWPMHDIAQFNNGV